MIRKGKILVVDDEPVIRMFVEKVALRCGYGADSAPDALSAMEAMSKTDYSAVISDIRMPGKDGIWLLEEVKKQFPDTQVIMLTASDSIEDAIASLNFGAEKYLLKPLHIEELSHALNKVMERRRFIIRDRNHRIWMEKKLKEQKTRIGELFLGSMNALATTLEAKDKYIRGHSERVAELSSSFVEFIGLKKKFLEKLKIASSLHDIGKIGVKEAVLNKPGRLTEEEYKHIKKHPALSEQIVMPIIEDRDIIQSIRHHHERYDGKGYPDGLREKEIPIGGRIIALADALDAMTSDRAYRKAYSKRKAMERIKENAGEQFDPELAKKFLDMIGKRGDNKYL